MLYSDLKDKERRDIIVINTPVLLWFPNLAQNSFLLSLGLKCECQ